jgi:hypothetical protein
MPTVTAIVEDEVWYAYTAAELEGLLEEVLGKAHVGWAGSLAAWGDGSHEWDHRLRVSTDVLTGWGALNFLYHSRKAAGWEGWNSFNEELPAWAPELPFGRGPWRFPQSASLPLEQVKGAVEQYCETRGLPTCVKWQEANIF